MCLYYSIYICNITPHSLIYLNYIWSLLIELKGSGMLYQNIDSDKKI